MIIMMLFILEILHESVQAGEIEVRVPSGQAVCNNQREPCAVPVLSISEMSQSQYVCPKTR